VAAPPIGGPSDEAHTASSAAHSSAPRRRCDGASRSSGHRRWRQPRASVLRSQVGAASFVALTGGSIRRSCDPSCAGRMRRRGSVSSRCAGSITAPTIAASSTTRGERAVEAAGWARLTRIKVLPVAFAPPFGATALDLSGRPPLRAKITVECDGQSTSVSASDQSPSLKGSTRRSPARCRTGCPSSKKSAHSPSSDRQAEAG
jgi:hypothetical protein